MVSDSKVFALILVSGVNAYFSPIHGHDFDFDVVYPSGLSFSTTNPPSEPLALNEIQNNASLPQVTLRNLMNSSSSEQALYLSFVVVTYVEPSQSYPSLELRTPIFAWIRANQTISEDGTLGGGGSDENNGKSDLHNVGLFKNASLHVWQQTQNVTDYLFKNNIAGTLWWELGDILINSTLEGTSPPHVGYDFQRANIDFDLRNDTKHEDPKSAAAQPILSTRLFTLCTMGALLTAYIN